MERYHLCNSGRVNHEEQFCEIILNLDQIFRRKCCLKVFLIWSSGSPFVQQSGTICATSVKGRVHHEEQFCLIIFEFGPVFQMLF